MEKIKDMTNRALRIVDKRIFDDFFGSAYQEDLTKAETIEHKDFVEVRSSNRMAVYLVRFLKGDKFDSEFLDFDIKRMELYVNGYEFTRSSYDSRENAECRTYLSAGRER